MGEAGEPTPRRSPANGNTNIHKHHQVPLAGKRFTGITRIRALAEIYSAELAPHNAFGPIQHAATIQFDASTNNLLIQESFYEFWPEWKRKLIKDPFKIEDGNHLVPRRPGLGIYVEDSVLHEFRIPEVRTPYSEEPVWVVKNTWKSYTEE